MSFPPSPYKCWNILPHKKKTLFHWRTKYVKTRWSAGKSLFGLHVEVLFWWKYSDGNLFLFRKQSFSLHHTTWSTSSLFSLQCKWILELLFFEVQIRVVKAWEQAWSCNKRSRFKFQLKLLHLSLTLEHAWSQPIFDNVFKLTLF